MKKTLSITALLLACVLLYGVFFCLIAHAKPSTEAGANLCNGWYYALTTEVVELDHENDVVVCEDFNGNLWEFYGCEDWQVGDIASLLMNSHGTEQIFDDEIELARYNGTFEGWN